MHVYINYACLHTCMHEASSEMYLIRALSCSSSRLRLSGMSSLSTTPVSHKQQHNQYFFMPVCLQFSLTPYHHHHSHLIFDKSHPLGRAGCHKHHLPAVQCNKSVSHYHHYHHHSCYHCCFCYCCYHHLHHHHHPPPHHCDYHFTFNKSHPLGEDVVGTGHDHHFTAVQRDAGISFTAHVKHGWNTECTTLLQYWL